MILKKKYFCIFFIDHLENPEHHLLVMGCDTRLSNIQQMTNPLMLRTLSGNPVHGNELRQFMGPGIPPTLTISVARGFLP